MTVPTVDAFCAADYGEWLAKYHASRPDSKIDIGVACKVALDDVVCMVKESKREEERARKAQELAEREAREAQEKAELQARAEEERRNPKFTIGELKSLTAFMELCNISAIDLQKIKNFLAMIDAKVKETQE